MKYYPPINLKPETDLELPMYFENSGVTFVVVEISEYNNPIGHMILDNGSIFLDRIITFPLDYESKKISYEVFKSRWLTSLSKILNKLPK
jgi:hypothetical protein